MNQKELEIEFKKVCKYRNFITPWVLEYKEIKNYIIEISRNSNDSSDFFGCIYGFTVIVKDNDGTYKKCPDKAFCTGEYFEILNKLKELENE